MQSDLASTPLPGWAKSVEDQFPFSEAISKKTTVKGPSDRLLAGTNKTSSSTFKRSDYVHPYAQQDSDRGPSFDVSYRKSDSGIPEYNAFEDPHCSYARTNDVARRAQKRMRREQEQQVLRRDKSSRQRQDYDQPRHSPQQHRHNSFQQQQQLYENDELHGKENRRRRTLTKESNTDKQRRPKVSLVETAKPSVSYQHGFVDPERELSVIKLILLREGQLRSATALVRRCEEENNAKGKLVSMTTQLIELIECIRESTVGVVEAISAWKRSAEAQPLKASVQSPVFMWSSGNYLLSIPNSLDFLERSETLRTWLGSSFIRNPFALPGGLDAFAEDSEILSMMSRAEERGEGGDGTKEEERDLEENEEEERHRKARREGEDEIDAIIAITNGRRATTSTADIAAWIGDQAVDRPDLPYRIRQSAATVLLEERIFGRCDDGIEVVEKKPMEQRDQCHPSSQRRSMRSATTINRSLSNKSSELAPKRKIKQESGAGKVKVLSTFRPGAGKKGKQHNVEKKEEEGLVKVTQGQASRSTTSVAGATAATAAAAAAAAVKNSQGTELVVASSSVSASIPTAADPRQNKKKEPIYARIRKAKEDAKILKDELAKLQLELDAEEEELALLEKAEARGW